jgi:hypothetical protein
VSLTEWLCICEENGWGRPVGILRTGVFADTSTINTPVVAPVSLRRHRNDTTEEGVVTLRVLFTIVNQSGIILLNAIINMLSISVEPVRYYVKLALRFGSRSADKTDYITKRSYREVF